MKPATLTALFLLAAASAVPARPPADAKGPPVDTSFLKRYAETRGFLLGRPVKPKVSPDGKAVLFLRSGPDSARQSLFEFTLASGQTREVLSPDAILKGAAEVLSPEEKARRERQRVSAGGFADFYLNPDGTLVLVKLGNMLYVFDRAAGTIRTLKSGGDGPIVDPKWSPDGKLIAYARGFDVACYDLATDREFAVTTGGTVVKTHGLAEFVAQEEMGRHSGFWWSPDSKSIAYAETDHTGVEQWFVADPLKPDVSPAPQYYPRPGKKNVAVRLGIKPVTGGETVWVEWDRAKYEYLARVVWAGTDVGKPELIVAVQDRAQRSLVLTRVNAATGKATPLIEEKDAAWVNIPGEVPVWTAESLVWVGTGPDGLEIQRRDRDTGKLASVVVRGTENVLGLVGAYRRVDLDLYPHAPAYCVSLTAPDPTQQHVRVAKVDPVPSQITPLAEPWEKFTTEPGMHTATFGQLGHSAVTSTTLRQMPRTTVFDENRTARGELPSVAAEPPFQPNVTVEKVGDYWTAVVRPRDFDPKKKYPVILDVYGGPRHLHVVQAMRSWLVPQWLADQGFVVVAVDNRGTPARGRDWERAVYQRFGTVPLDDQVKGLHALCDKFPELDRDRVGIVGWSFGGYMAANGVLRRPDVFKAAVAGAPVTDWEDYDTHYTERYMGLLPESKAAYQEASLLPLAATLDRPLLLVHGTADDNVYYRHTLRLSDALFRAGRPFEALALPGVTHMYSADPVVMERLWSRNAGFFRTHLGGPR
ncbi:MAG TPA: prolyl oligopeptidase family serine peptidase [Urbifossiella sp.]|jgi:dipeptidyl-peptidase-4|nr:prolyl oligopeptidase family serine peptidase [Urbifossiella sp.]